MKYTEEIQEEIKALKADGISSRDIAEILGISKSGVNDFLKEAALVKASEPKVLLLDLENAPSIAAAFQRFDVTLTPDHILEEGGWLLSASWKWLNKSKVEGVVLTPEEAVARNDYRIVETIVEEMNKADIWIAHNGDRFDIPLVRTRMLPNGITGLRSAKTIDTLKIAKRLKFNSNKLDSLGNYLSAGRKLKHTGIDLWLRCMNGDPKALKEMLTYNKRDVVLLEDVYKELRQFDTSGVNFGMYYDDGKHHCPACASTNVSPTGRKTVAGMSKYEEVICHDCGRISRKRQALNSKAHRTQLLAKA